MTGLASALSSALSGLLVTSGQSAVVSRNVTRASDEDYSRRDVGLTVNRDGTAQLGSYTRSEDKTLLDKVLTAKSRVGASAIALTSLEILSSTIGDPQDGSSIAATLHQLQQSLSDFHDNPSSRIFATEALTAARSIASRLNAAAADVAKVRSEAHAEAKSSVQKINALLTELKPVDQAIRSGVPGTEAYLDKLDQRDGILKLLSVEIGLRTVYKSDGGTAIYTDGGLTLFDVVPRSIEFNLDAPIVSGLAGPSLSVDAVQLNGGSPELAAKHGRLAGALKVRDGITLTYEAQLDETARSLINLFAETDQSATPVLAPKTGLFKYAGSPAVPAAAILVPGLAGQIHINPLFDERSGGNPMLLRDGGSNGMAFNSNPAGTSGYQQRLAEMTAAFDKPSSYNPAAQLGTTLSIKQFAEASASTVETERSTASRLLNEAQATSQRWSEVLLSKSGVNLDNEMASLLALEKSYQASAKVMTTIDQMFGILVGIVN